MRGLHHDENFGLLVALFLLIYAFVNFTFPASHWFEVVRMDVRDTVEGELAVIDYKRTIHRRYWADWHVEVSRIDGGDVSQVCSTIWQREDYDPDDKLPVPVTLDWMAFTDPKCFTLGPGDYRISVTWTINPSMPAALFLGRSVTATDAFTILPRASE